jgi:hypothetical protein
MADTIQGFYRDRLIGPDGVIRHDSGWRPNLIVLRGRVLLAAFLRNDNALGIQSLQVGRGDPAWDTGPIPPADPATTTRLVDDAPHTTPAAQLVFEYLDQAEGVVAGPTNRIQVVTTLGPGVPVPAGQPPFPLREFGLFGARGGQPFMLDYIRHPLIEKDAAITLERRVRLLL